jgi:hypothetical protein
VEWMRCLEFEACIDATVMSEIHLC